MKVLAGLCAVFVLCGTDALGQTLTLEIQDGRVSLDARDVTVEQILDRWAAVTGATIVGAGRLSTDIVTLALVDESERDALRLILRQTGGYILGIAADARPGAPRIDRIFVLDRASPPTLDARTRPSMRAAGPSPPPSERQVGLGGPEQELVDFAEGLIENPHSLATVEIGTGDLDTPPQGDPAPPVAPPAGGAAREVEQSTGAVMHVF
jgi:hypothetical protein